MLTNPKPLASVTPAKKSTSTAASTPWRRTPIQWSDGIIYYRTADVPLTGFCSLCRRSSEQLTTWKSASPSWSVNLCRRCTDRRTRKKI